MFRNIYIVTETPVLTRRPLEKNIEISTILVAAHVFAKYILVSYHCNSLKNMSTNSFNIFSSKGGA